MAELVKIKGLKGKQNKKKWAKNIDVSLLANLELLNQKLYDEQALNDIYKKANDLKNSHSKSKFEDKIDALLGVITHKNLEGKFQKVYSTSEKVQGSFTF